MLDGGQKIGPHREDLLHEMVKGVLALLFHGSGDVLDLRRETEIGEVIVVQLPRLAEEGLELRKSLLRVELCAIFEAKLDEVCVGTKRRGSLR